MSPVYDQRLKVMAVAVRVVVAVTLGIIIGRATATRVVAPPLVTSVDGIPVEHADTRAGVLAAADNDLAIASQTVEQNPHLFARLVAVAYAPGVRSRTLTQAAALRRADRTAVANYASGGRAVAVIAARRLDTFTRRRAVVTSWLGGFVWGPRLAPRQSWNLVQTVLTFERGRWLVTSSAALRTPAPVPSVVFIDGHNNQTSAFDTRLTGMSAPFYGSS
jgi:hypothetical protein